MKSSKYKSNICLCVRSEYTNSKKKSYKSSPSKQFNIVYPNKSSSNVLQHETEHKALSKSSSKSSSKLSSKSPIKLPNKQVIKTPNKQATKELVEQSKLDDDDDDNDDNDDDDDDDDDEDNPTIYAAVAIACDACARLNLPPI